MKLRANIEAKNVLKPDLKTSLDNLTSKVIFFTWVVVVLVSSKNFLSSSRSYGGRAVIIGFADNSKRR